MIHHPERLGIAALLIVLVGVAAAPARAGDPPDSEVNPLSGDIEITDSEMIGGSYDVRHVVNPRDGRPPVVSIVSTASLDDLAPRLAIQPSGETWITWWRDGATDEVWIRKHSAADGSWSSARLVSEPGESARAPEIATFDSGVWVAYEFDDGPNRGVAVRAVHDEPDPFPLRTHLHSPASTGELDLRLHDESGKLWATWVEDATSVGWCEYDPDSDTWAVVRFEPCTDEDDDAARSRIRDQVVHP